MTRVPLSKAEKLAPFVVLKLVAVVALGSDHVSNEAGALKDSVVLMWFWNIGNLRSQRPRRDS